MTPFVKEYLTANWEKLELGPKPDELLFIKFADRRIRAADVGLISFLVKGRYGSSEKSLFVLRFPRYPDNKEANQSLELEYKNLKTIHGTLAAESLREAIPKVVVWDQIKGVKILAISFLSGSGINQEMAGADLLKNYLRLAQLTFSWLIEFQKDMGRPALASAEGIVENVSGEYAALFPDKMGARVNYFSRLKAAARELSGEAIPQFPQHGDLHAENIFAAGGKVTGVIDWEDFSLEGIPGFDVFHFIRTYFEALLGYAVGRVDLALLDKLSAGEDTFNAIRITLVDYFNKMGIDPRFESIWVPICLIQSANFAGCPRKKAGGALGVLDLLLQLEPFTLEELFLYMSIFNYRDLAKKAVELGSANLANDCLERIKKIQEKAKQSFLK